MWSLVSKCVAVPKSLCPDLLNDSDSVFTQCLMHHAVRPRQEWRGNSGDSAPIHHSAVAETCAAISTLAHTLLPQPGCFSPFPIQHSFSFPLLISYLSSLISITLPLPLYHIGLSFLSLSPAVIHQKVSKGQSGRQMNGEKKIQWGEILRKSEALLLLTYEWFLHLSQKCYKSYICLLYRTQFIDFFFSREVIPSKLLFGSSAFLVT